MESISSSAEPMQQRGVRPSDLWLAGLAGLSITLGFAIPVFYDWSHSGDSRLPRMERAALLSAAGTVLLILGLAVRLRMQPEVPKTDPLSSSRVTISRILGLTAMVAVGLAFARWLPWDEFRTNWIHWGLAGGLSCLTVWAVRWRHGWRLLGLFGIMYGSFTWMFAYNRPWGHASGLLEMVPTAPGFWPASGLMYAISGDLGRDSDWSRILAAVWVIAILGIGCWLFRFRGRWLIGFEGGLLGVTMLGSMVIHVLYRN